jgi:hypothetical protein
VDIGPHLKKVAKKPAAKKAPATKAKAPTQPAKPAASSGGGDPQKVAYTPQPIQGAGWAPFRYPPQ